MKRAKLRGLNRNASVVLGNIRSVEDVPSLASALEDSGPLVRVLAAWTLGRIGSLAALEVLRARATNDVYDTIAMILRHSIYLATQDTRYFA